MKPDPDLNAAYALKTPEDSVRLYRDWAKTYDQDFAADMDYVYPTVVAQVFADFSTGKAAPVLDVGAGTGLVGAALGRLGTWAIDGLDISAEMLEVAAAKGSYRSLYQGDLTGKLDLPGDTYGGVISAGTFTHGHVGPDALDELLRLATRGALFTLGINAQVYAAQGFAAKFDTLHSQITGFELVERGIYGDKANADHAADKALIAVFRKA